ncbi:MAG TPA: GNAT family N-acetyltransferase [Streptosporangiales bacterium]
MESVEVHPLRDPSEETVARLAELLRQLSSSARPLDRETLRRTLDCPTNTLLVAWQDGRPVGMLTLVVFPIPSGIRAWIEDVVVDEDLRGHGIGATLTNEAVRVAHIRGARTIDLTSRPSRVAANRMYQRLGFQQRESTVYRYEP